MLWFANTGTLFFFPYLFFRFFFFSFLGWVGGARRLGVR